MMAIVSLAVVDGSTKGGPSCSDWPHGASSFLVPFFVRGNARHDGSRGLVTFDALVIVDHGILEVSGDGAVGLHDGEVEMLQGGSLSGIWRRRSLRSFGTRNAGECPAAPAMMRLDDGGETFRLIAVVVEIGLRGAVPGLRPSGTWCEGHGSRNVSFFSFLLLR